MSDETESKKSRRWPVLVTCGLVLLFLLATATVSFETWRQNRIGNAETELLETALAIASDFSHVDDWEAWYRAQYGKNWGGDHLTRLIQEVFEYEAGPDGSYHELGNFYLIGSFKGPEVERPDAVTMRKFLASSDKFSVRALELSRYSNITLPPKFRDGTPELWLLESLSFFRLLETRALCHALLGDADAAWTEWSVLMELASRHHHGKGALDYMFGVWINSIPLACFVALASIHPVPAMVVAHLPMAIPELDLRRIVQGELAFVAQVVHHPDFVSWYADDYAKFGWFGWLLEPSLSDLGDRLLNADDTLRDAAAYHRLLRALPVVLERGGRIPSEFLGNTHMGAILERVNSGWHWQVYNVLAANLVYDLRRAQAEGTALSSFQPNSRHYGPLEVELRPEGWAELRWQPSEGLLFRLTEPLGRSSRMNVDHDPVRLRTFE